MSSNIYRTNALSPKWTMEEVKLLKSMYLEGNREGITKALKERSWNAVKLKAERLGLRYPRVYSENCREIQFRSTSSWGYILGLIIGDGSLSHYKRNYQIDFWTTEKKMVDLFMDAFKSSLSEFKAHIVMKRNRKPDGSATSPLYHIVVFSKRLYQLLKQYKLEDYKWNFPDILTTEEGIVGFLQGLYDTEGSVSGCAHGYGIKLSLSSKHKENLVQVKTKLKKLNIKSHPYRRHHCCELVTCDKESLCRFFNRINFRLPRKSDKLAKLLQMRGWLSD